MPTTLAKPLLSLPRVNLKTEHLSLPVLEFIPLETVEKYQVVAFKVEGHVLKLAIVHPDQLKQGFQIALREIGSRVGKEIKVFQTDASSLKLAVSTYQRLLEEKKEVNLSSLVTPEWKDAPNPPLFELGETVAFNYLLRVPLEYAKKFRILSVDFLRPNTYWFVTDDPHPERLSEITDFVEKKNKIKTHLMVISSQAFNDLLSYYAFMLGQIKEAKESTEDTQIKVSHEEESLNVQNYPLAKGVIVPQIQATIVSSDPEKPGIAGIFQKVAQSFVPSKDISEDIPEEKLPAATPTPERKLIPVQPIPASSLNSPVSNSASQEVHSPNTVSSVPVLSPAVTEVSGGGGDRGDTNVPTSSANQGARTAVTSEDNSDIGKLLSKQVESLSELKEHVQKGFVPRLVAAIVSYAIHLKASDIHVESFEDEVRIRYRVDGQLLDIIKLSPETHASMVSRIKILSRLRLDENRIPQDGRFEVKLGEAQVDVRVSVMPTVHGEKVVMRVLDKSQGIASLEDLGLTGLGYSNLLKAINKPFGICLATGPTGSGKSTTLYAILNRIATPNVNVVTLEDPVEYEMKGINQSQVRPKIGFSFAEGLRSVLRQDPNIIMVGEIRDAETANMATQAALTGHLVLSSLHTNDSSGAIPRLNNMGIEPFLIASSLNVAIGQRLVRKICPICKSEVTVPNAIRDKIVKELDEVATLNSVDAKRVIRPVKFYQGSGCSNCGGSGYRGRVGIFEILIMSEALEELTMIRSTGNQVQQQAQKEGMLTMYQDGLLKVTAGITTLDEVLRETSNK